MERPLSKLTRYNYEWQNNLNREYVDSMRDRLANYDADREKQKRLALGKCKYCHYIQTSRIGGAAVTRYCCGLCGYEQVAVSTATDCLCLECAKERGLCKICGGDIDGVNRRKKDLEFRERVCD